MTYDVQLTRAARKDVLALGDDVYSRLSEAIDALQDDPRPPGVRKLRGGKHAWRLRVGDYRVLYEVDDQGHVVIIYRVRHRREAYR